MTNRIAQGDSSGFKFETFIPRLSFNVDLVVNTWILSRISFQNKKIRI